MAQVDIDGLNSKVSTDKIQGQSGTTVTIPTGHNLVGNGSGLTSLPAGNLTGTVPVNKGGTGATTHTANNVLVGNGTSAIGSVAPSTSGNVLTSNGTSWASTAPAAGGKVLQVVHSSTNTTYTVGTSDADVTNHNLSISPTSATSTILVFVRIHYLYSASDSGWGMTLRRTVGGASTDVHSDSTAYAYYGETGATNRRGEISLNYKDSPNTTSAITYTVRARKNSGTVQLNAESIGSITAFEIGA